MNDERRELLTEFLGERWHEPSKHADDECVCGAILYCNKDPREAMKKHCARNNRTFTTPDDLHRVYFKMVEKGYWEDFTCFSGPRCNWDLRPFFEPTRFYELAVEFLEGRNK